MGLAAILSRSPARILVYGLLASRGRTGINVRDGVERSRHCVSSFRCLSVSTSMSWIGISVAIADVGTVSLGCAGASPRTVWMGGLSVIILRSNFAMLQGRGERGKKKPISKITLGWPVGKRYLAISNSSVCLRASPRTKLVQHSGGGVKPLGLCVAILQNEGSKPQNQKALLDRSPHHTCWSDSRFGSAHPGRQVGW